ncbi:MAG: sortase [Oscillospiraceae bacterium]
MKKYTLITLSIFFLNLLFLYFGIVNPITFTQLSQNPAKTLAKYQSLWNDTTIRKMPYTKKDYLLGDIIGTLTIPSLEIYELPIYYGTTDENKNWQITTPGYEENWQLFGEYGLTALGAHNYQLFHELPKVKPGEKFIVETPDDVYVYKVQESLVFHSKLEKWADTVYTGKKPYGVNLITCYPDNALNTPDRYVVYATLQKGTIFTQNLNSGKL